MRRRNELALGLAGDVGAGKTTIATFLSRQFGFETVGDPTRARYDLARSYVIDCLRHEGDPQVSRDRLGDRFKLLYVAAPEDLRRERLIHRSKSSGDPVGEPPPPGEAERSVRRMLNQSDAVVMNVDLDEAATQVSALVLRWMYGSRPTAIREMVEAVTEFHRKHGFDIGTRDQQTMHYRIGLLVEELGEINECLSKGRGDINEEHADLFILLLGNCVTMSIDLEAAFWSKYVKIMKRPAKRVGGTVRVSHWRNGSADTSEHGYYHVDVESLLRVETEGPQEPPAERHDAQLSLFA